MSDPPFTIRIHTENNQDMDWMVQPEEVTFRKTLEVISQVMPHATVTAFEYEDEDGDHITVRSDEEMRDMFAAYFRELSEEDRTRGLLPPLIIFPKMGKTPQNRNIHGLKIKTSASSQNVPTDTTGAADLQTILQCGNINETQLQRLEPLGSGNGGHVYRALHRPSGRVMAVKEIQLNISHAVQRQIICELEILYKVYYAKEYIKSCGEGYMANKNRCNSRAIIAFYGAFFTESRISICTEYMDGSSLDKYMPIPEAVLGRIATCIVEGLLYMWNLKIMHRDVKPSNVLVNTSGEVKLCDFGVSVQLVKSIATTFIGTNVYMAPERLQGKDYGKSAEIWSIGVTLFELASGILPFKSITPDLKPFQLMQCIIEESTLVLPVDRFSSDFIHFVSQCMQKDPDKRLSIADMMNHEFLRRHSEDTAAVISQWVQSKVQQMRQTRGSLS